MMENFVEASVSFQSGTVWSFYFWVFVFFFGWALLMLRGGMNRGKHYDD